MATNELPADPELVWRLWVGVVVLSVMVVVSMVMYLWAERSARDAMNKYIRELENNERICKVLIREGVLSENTCYIRSARDEP